MEHVEIARVSNELRGLPVRLVTLQPKKSGSRLASRDCTSESNTHLVAISSFLVRLSALHGWRMTILSTRTVDDGSV